MGQHEIAYRAGFEPEGQCAEHGCSGQATHRINRKTGQSFWGCSEYPKCKNAISGAEQLRRRNLEPPEEDYAYYHYR